ncbi:MAG: ABC transporter permease [Chloroflexota bacterium]
MAALLVGLLCGLLNGFFVAVVGLPSLAVTLATLIGFRGIASMLIEDKSVGGFPAWFTDVGQSPLGPLRPASRCTRSCLRRRRGAAPPGLGSAARPMSVGNSADVAVYSGVRVAWVRIRVFMMSGLVAAIAGVLYAARLGAVRASNANGFELDIITVVLLGGVSIFGGSGSMLGVALSTLLVLNLRNGLGLAGVTGQTQTGYIGVLLILSVLVPNVYGRVQDARRRRAAARGPQLPLNTAPGAPTADGVT